MKRKNIIRFKDHARARPVDPSLGPGHRAVNIVLPVIRVERFDTPSMADPPFAPPPTKRKASAREIRRRLQDQTEKVRAALVWLANVGTEGADPHAIAALLAGEAGDGYHIDADYRAAATWLHEFAIAWQREQHKDRA